MSNAFGSGSVNLPVEGLQVGEVIGRGGFSTVYKAWDDNHYRWVALKVIAPNDDPEAMDRSFDRERKIAGQLSQHPHVVTIYQTGRLDSGETFMVMEYLPGGSLTDLVRRKGALSWDEAVELITPIASALDYAQSIGVVHNDIKPANIFLGHGTALLGDFGIATHVALTATRRSAATVYYAPPEFFLSGDRDARSDVYSLAATFFYLLDGKPPFYRGARATEGQIIRMVLDTVPVFASYKPTESQEHALARGMAKDPAQRPPSAGALVALLKQAAKTGTAQSPDSDRADEPNRPPHPAKPSNGALPPHPGQSAQSGQTSYPPYPTKSSDGGQPPHPGQSAQSGQTSYPPYPTKSSNGGQPPHPGQSGRVSEPPHPGQSGRVSEPPHPGQSGRVSEPPHPGQSGRASEPPHPGQSGRISEPPHPGQAGQAGQPPHPGQSSRSGLPPHPGRSGESAQPPYPNQPVSLFGSGGGAGSVQDLPAKPANRSASPLVKGGGDVRPLALVFAGAVAVCLLLIGYSLYGGGSDDEGSGVSIEEIPGRIAVWSPSGSLLATATPDMTIEIRDGVTGELVGGPFTHGAMIADLDWSADGTKLASASWDETAKIWDVKTGEQLGGDYDAHRRPLVGVAWSPDGSTLASADTEQRIVFWDGATGLPNGLVVDLGSGIDGLDWSADGSRLVVQPFGFSGLRLLDPTTGQEVAEGPDGGTMVWQLSPDGSRLAEEGPDDSVSIVRLADGKPITSLVGHSDFLLALAWSPSGDKLATASADNTVRIWDTKTFEEVITPIDLGRADPNTVAFSPDGTLVAVGYNETFAVWSAETGERITDEIVGTSTVDWLGWSADGKLFASLSSVDVEVRPWPFG